MVASAHGLYGHHVRRSAEEELEPEEDCATVLHQKTVGKNVWDPTLRTRPAIQKAVLVNKSKHKTLEIIVRTTLFKNLEIDMKFIETFKRTMHVCDNGAV